MFGILPPLAVHVTDLLADPPLLVESSEISWYIGGGDAEVVAGGGGTCVLGIKGIR